MRIKRVRAILALCLLIGTVAAEIPTEDSPRSARFLAAYSTWTQVSFTTSTTTISDTCATAVATTACSGRKRRRALRRLQVPGESEDLGLGASIGEAPELVLSVDGEDTGARSARQYALTVWSSVTSTYTIVATSTNTATKYSVSFMCSVTSAAFPPSCG